MIIHCLKKDLLKIPETRGAITSPGFWYCNCLLSGFPKALPGQTVDFACLWGILSSYPSGWGIRSRFSVIFKCCGSPKSANYLYYKGNCYSAPRTAETWFQRAALCNGRLAFYARLSVFQVCSWCQIHSFDNDKWLDSASGLTPMNLEKTMIGQRRNIPILLWLCAALLTCFLTHTRMR